MGTTRPLVHTGAAALMADIRGARLRTFATTLAVVLAAALTAAPHARAQPTLVDVLLDRLFDSDVKDTYDLTADFTGTLRVKARGSELSVDAEGSFHEWRGADGIRRRQVAVRKLSVPLLLRPFAASIGRAIEERIETQSENPETFYAHDIFLSAQLPERRYVLAGVHRSIVDEAIDRYGKPQDKLDVTTRRKIAEWLYSAPTMREFLVRPGPPYAMRAVIDDAGVLHELVLHYDWGQVRTRVSYIYFNGQPLWERVEADTVSELSGVGRVTGQLSLVFTNHCVNCKR